MEDCNTESNIDTSLVVKDVPKAVTLLTDLTKQADDLKLAVIKFINRVQEGELNTSKGVSLLELKCQMLLSYLINVTYLIHHKTHGRKLDGDIAVLRLAEIRTVLERMRPIEQKLKYHIDKLVKTASGHINENDPLRLRANPANLMNKLQGESGGLPDESDNEETVTKSNEASKAYVPPKLAAMHYDEDIGENERQRKLMEQARKRALSSSIMRDLRAEYYDGPEEIQESIRSHKKGVDGERKQRTEYEEEYFVRLNTSKKEKHNQMKRAFTSDLEDVTHFGDIRALTGEDALVGHQKSNKKRRKNVSKKIKKKSRKFIKKGH